MILDNHKLLKKSPEIKNPDPKETIKSICNWQLDFKDILIKRESEEEANEEDEDNILKALLEHRLEDLTIEFMGMYGDVFINKTLFLFSLANNYNLFIQQSLLIGAFDKQIFKSPEVVDKILECLKFGSKTNFLLNTMILTDVSLWKNDKLVNLIEMLSGFIDDPFEENRLLLSNNPLMSIALSAEILGIIASSRKRFENECEGLKGDLLDLGKVYNEKIDEDEYFQTLMYDTDFQNRTVLKIITSCKFEQLLS